MRGRVPFPTWIVLVVAAGLAHVRMDAHADEPDPIPGTETESNDLDDQPVDQAPNAGEGETDVGLGVLGGAATLGGCRSSEYMLNPTASDPPLVRYTIKGDLNENEADVRSLLDSAMPVNKKGRFWSEETCLKLRGLTFDMRYHLDMIEKSTPKGVELELTVHPMTLIRHIEVEGNYSLAELDLEPIFKEEIRRRLHLRPGSTLEDDPEKRRAQFAIDEQRVLEYLARHGYFDAEVTITARPAERPHEATIRVTLKKGRGYIVGKITVKGNTAVRDREIVEAMTQRWCPNFVIVEPCFAHHRFSFDRLKTDIQKVKQLYQKRYGYPGVRVRTNYNPATSPDRASKTVRFEVDIDERKKIDVAFEGNHDKSNDELKNLLTFNEDNAYDDFEAENSAEAIRAAYQGDGRFQTIVIFERYRLLPNYDRVLFHIDEGPEQKVEGIRFEGNTSLTNDDLRGVIATKEFPSRALELFASGGYVTFQQLAQDVEAIQRLYQLHGFPNATATAEVANNSALLGAQGAIAAQVTADDSGGGLYVRYHIIEGIHEVVKTVDYVGNNREVTDQELAAVTKLHPGVPFTANTMHDDEEAIVRHYREKGYLYAVAVAHRVGTGEAIRITYDIVEGQLVHFGKVIVRGNFKTKRWVISDTLGFREGDLLTLTKLESGQSNLRSTDLFSSVRPPQLVGRDPVNMIIDVEERYDTTAEIEIGAGYSTDNSFFVSGTLALKNMFGIGTSLVGTLELGTQRKRATATLGFPQWVMQKGLGIPARLDLSARYRLDDDPRLGELETVGGTAAFSRKLSEGVYLSFKYDWNRFNRSTELIRPAGADEDLTSAPISTTTASLGPAIVIDHRKPTPLTPTRGYALSASLSVASKYLLGTDDFIKLGLSGQLLIPIGKRIVITNTVRYDQGIPLGSSPLLPEVERYTAGGDATLVRGFEEEMLHTEVIKNPLAPIGDVSNVRVVPAGGNIRFIHNFDVQVRVWDKSWLFGLPIASAIFLDSAFITNSFDKFTLNKIRQGLGVALARLVTPVGSFSIEYAFPLDPQIGDDPTGRLHFNFGFVF